VSETKRPLGRTQQKVYDALVRHKVWHVNCGWVWDTVRGTAQIMESLVRRGVVTKQTELGCTVYRPASVVDAALCDKYIAVGLADNEYLRGDDCKSTRKYLLGWITALLRLGEKRIATDEERAYILAKIDAFLKG